MNFELHLPLWAILYCGLIFANGILTIHLSSNKSISYMLSQLLSTAFMISFFFVYYDIVEKPDRVIIVLMVLFILFQEIWVNREIYQEMVFKQIPHEHKNSAIFTIGILMIVFLLPLFYVLAMIF